MNQSLLDSAALLLFSMGISLVLATLYIRERMKSKENN
ncbi:hypothetical protein J2Z48_000201 [Croceifilum oryzae]|uniref:Uncharacterized protein n=1 Tax=Croceifilum oryzae TaxID=1553429 RepID=A0AAJ1TC40_9BACL|nr:hypothetical protein [Croceifilum oryzae]